MVTIIRIALGGLVGALAYDGSKILYNKVKVCIHDYRLEKKKENGITRRLLKRFLPKSGK